MQQIQTAKKGTPLGGISGGKGFRDIDVKGQQSSKSWPVHDWVSTAASQGRLSLSNKKTCLLWGDERTSLGRLKGDLAIRGEEPGLPAFCAKGSAKRGKDVVRSRETSGCTRA